MDVVFLLDVLGSDVTPGFGRLLVFVGDVIDRLPLIGRQATRVGLVTYAEHPRVEIFLDDFDNKDDLQVPAAACALVMFLFTYRRIIHSFSFILFYLYHVSPYTETERETIQTQTKNASKKREK